MARKLSKFNWGQQSRMTEGEKATYEWDDWFDGNIWKLTPGKDFQTHPLMMERIIRTRATGRGVKVRLRHVSANGENFAAIVLQRIHPPVELPTPEVEKAPVKAAAKTPARKAPAKPKAEANGNGPSKTPGKPRKAPAKRAAKQPVSA